MKILRDYAESYNFDYDDLLSDFINSSPEEQEDFLMQIGGQTQEAPSIEEIIMAYSQVTGEDPNVIFEQLNQIPEEQRQQVLNQMIEEIQKASQQQEPQMQSGGVPYNPNGYYELDPAQDPYAYIPTNDGSITMEGLDYPINAYDGYSGEFLTTMQPDQEYTFDTDLVLEEPLVYAQKGRAIKTALEKFNINSGKVALGASPITLTNRRPEQYQEDSMLEDLLEIVDPTGISSWDDVYRQGVKTYQDPSLGNIASLAVEGLSAVPIIGTTGRVLKGTKFLKNSNLINKMANASTASNWLSKGADFVGDALSGISILDGQYQTGSSPTLDVNITKFFKDNVSILQKELAATNEIKEIENINKRIKNLSDAYLNYKNTGVLDKNTEKIYNNFINSTATSTKLKGKLGKAVNFIKRNSPYLAGAAMLGYSELTNDVNPLIDDVSSGADQGPAKKMTVRSGTDGTERHLTLQTTGSEGPVYKDQYGNTWNTGEGNWPYLSFVEEAQNKAPSEAGVKTISTPTDKAPTNGTTTNPNTAPARAEKGVTKKNNNTKTDPKTQNSEESRRFSNLDIKPIDKIAPKNMAVSKTITKMPVIEKPNLSKAKPESKPPIRIASFNKGLEGINNILRASQFAKAVEPAAPVFRSTARYNFSAQPLINFEPIANSIQGQFNAIANNINPNSTTGMSVLSSLQSQALDQTVKAANQVALQNNEIERINNANAIQAANQQFMQQQQFDALAYDQFLRRDAARSMGITGAINDILAANNATMTRQTMLDMLPVTSPGLVDISTPLDRLLGRRSFGQNPDLNITYGNNSNNSSTIYDPNDTDQIKINKLTAEINRINSQTELNRQRTQNLMIK